MQAKVVFQLCVANHNQHFKSEWLSLLRTVVVIRHIYSLENNKCVKFVKSLGKKLNTNIANKLDYPQFVFSTFKV